MSSLDIKPLRTEAFQSAVELDETTIVLTLSGCADLRVWRSLGDMLGALHEEALRLKATKVVVDVNDLEFMNSSCFKSIVTWLTSIMEQPASSQYRVHFRSNPNRLWQRRSLHALRSFALMIVTIEP